MPRLPRYTLDGRKFMKREEILAISHAVFMIAQLVSDEDLKKIKPFLEEIEKTLKETDK